MCQLCEQEFFIVSPYRYSSLWTTVCAYEWPTNVTITPVTLSLNSFREVDESATVELLQPTNCYDFIRNYSATNCSHYIIRTTSPASVTVAVYWKIFMETYMAIPVNMWGYSYVIINTGKQSFVINMAAQQVAITITKISNNIRETFRIQR
ncbi:hypothetical protein Btru_020849 [Bulinus truncatus]|nr:hypothetical protein Btru_020849 [Bulinus truncatus]